MYTHFRGPCSLSTVHSIRNYFNRESWKEIIQYAQNVNNTSYPRKKAGTKSMHMLPETLTE